MVASSTPLISTVGFELPNGCDQSAWRRMRDEWWLVWRIWRVRRSERERELGIISRHEKRMAEVVEQKSRDILLTALQRYAAADI